MSIAGFHTLSLAESRPVTIREGLRAQTLLFLESVRAAFFVRQRHSVISQLIYQRLQSARIFGAEVCEEHPEADVV
jgi:hypothetical protein